jgi:hypothetical protein
MWATFVLHWVLASMVSPWRVHYERIAGLCGWCWSSQLGSYLPLLKSTTVGNVCTIQEVGNRKTQTGPEASLTCFFIEDKITPRGWGGWILYSRALHTSEGVRYTCYSFAVDKQMGHLL